MSDATNPFNLLGHYILGTGQDVNISIEDLDESDWNISQHPQFWPTIERLKKKNMGEPTFVSFPSYRAEPNVNILNDRYNTDYSGIDRYNIDFNGNLTLKDHVWEFEGDVTGAKDSKYMDVYNFDPKKSTKERGLFGEMATRAGSYLPGRPFNMKLNGFRRYQQSGNY